MFAITLNVNRGMEECKNDPNTPPEWRHCSIRDSDVPLFIILLSFASSVFTMIIMSVLWKDKTIVSGLHYKSALLWFEKNIKITVKGMVK